LIKERCEMRKTFSVCLLFVLMVLLSTLVACSTNKSTELYYGQKPPGITPEIFAPGIISNPADSEYACTFTPDAKECYFTVRKDKTAMPQIMVSHLKNDKWTTPEKLNIPGEGLTLEPHITRDGKTLYFGAERIKKGDQTASEGIWKMTRSGDTWKDLNYVTDGMYVSTLDDGSIYLTDITRTGGLVKIPFDGKKFTEAVELVGGPNSPVKGIHPCIAPDESFIIFDCDRTDGFGGEGDLYVSFNNGDGTWSDGFNLGKDVNSAGVEFAASLSPDGKYIFFMKNYDIYWMDARVIEKFRPAKK
jgi:Tol biopolymer transport system component